MRDVLREFLEEECGAGIREILSREMTTPSSQRREFTFNRFNVTIDHQAAEVIIQDDLEPGPEGEFRMPSTEFARVLQSTSD